jgi:hypothetical protein
MVKVGGTRLPEETNNAAEALNSMLKEWDAQGVGLWQLKSVTLYPQKSTASYSLGPTGDNATLSGVSTETSAAASSGTAQSLWIVQLASRMDTTSVLSWIAVLFNGQR